MLYLKCKGQVVSIDVDERFADKYINANTVHFEFCERWAGMTITAQFTQNEKTYDVLVDEVTNTVTMPNEITVGEVEISVFGVHPETGVRLTTIPVKKKVEKSGFVGDGETPIPPSPDLYAQLIAKVEDAELAQAENIKNAVDAYLTENPVEPGATKEQAEQIEANRKAIEEYVPPVTSVNGMTGDVVIPAGGGAASSVEWSNVVNKPETYPPEAHGHTWNDVTEKPEAYPPSEHTHSYADLEDKPTIPTVPRFLPNPYSLTINGTSYDGSNAVEVTIDAGNDVEIDETLTQGGKAADAKKTGEAVSQLSEQIGDEWTAGQYDVGTYKIYANALWKAARNTTAQPGINSDWVRCSVSGELKTLNENDAQSDSITINQIGSQTTEIVFGRRPSNIFLLVHTYTSYSDSVSSGLAYFIRLSKTDDTDVGSMLIKDTSEPKEHLYLSEVAFNGSSNSMALTWGATGNRIISVIPFY